MRVQWTIVVTAETGDEIEGVMRLRGLLTAALRRFGMRCTMVSETRLVPSALRRERVGEGRSGVGRPEAEGSEVGRESVREAGLFG